MLAMVKHAFDNLPVERKRNSVGSMALLKATQSDTSHLSNRYSNVSQTASIRISVQRRLSFHNEYSSRAKLWRTQIKSKNKHLLYLAPKTKLSLRSTLFLSAGKCVQHTAIVAQESV